jgi:hypothetical protein
VHVVADGAVVHGDAEGPLSVRVAGGALSVRAPDEVPWHASFGTYLPCVTDPGTEVTSASGGVAGERRGDNARYC